MPCSTSRARQSWRPGWRGTLETPPLICSCAGVCTAVQTQGGAKIGIAAGFPLSRQAAQPERTPRPPHPSNTRHHHLPHGLQPQPLAAATFSPASARLWAWIPLSKATATTALRPYKRRRSATAMTGSSGRRSPPVTAAPAARSFTGASQPRACALCSAIAVETRKRASSYSDSAGR